MMLSNDGSFPEAIWQPYAETRPCHHLRPIRAVLPRFVYVAFKDQDGTVHEVSFDDIYTYNGPEQRCPCWRCRCAYETFWRIKAISARTVSRSVSRSSRCSGV